MEAATSAALLELAAPDAGAAAKSTAAVALPAALRKRERPTDWDPDRPLEKWQVGGLPFQKPGWVELRRQMEVMRGAVRIHRVAMGPTRLRIAGAGRSGGRGRYSAQIRASST